MAHVLVYILILCILLPTVARFLAFGMIFSFAQSWELAARSQASRSSDSFMSECNILIHECLTSVGSKSGDN